MMEGRKVIAVLHALGIAATCELCRGVNDSVEKRCDHFNFRFNIPFIAVVSCDGELVLRIRIP